MARFAILFFMSCPEPPMGISGVGSFPVWSGGSLNIFSSSLGVGNVALNRMFLLKNLRGRHGELHTQGASICPPVCLYTPYMFICPICLYTSICLDIPLYVPMLLYTSVCSRGCLHVIWGWGLPYGCAFGCPLCVQSPHISGANPTHLYTPMVPWTSVCSRGYLHVIWGINPTCWGLGGISMSVKHLVSVSTSTVLSLWVAAY